MALITNLITTALSRLISEEIAVWSPRAVRALVKLAVKLIPEAQRARFAEEWQSHVEEVPATVGKFVAAAGFLLAVCRIRLAESHDDDPFFWLDAPLRFRESYWKAFHAVNPIADDERLASDKDLNAIVDTIHRYISESDTLYKESSGKMSVWAEKRRKRQSRNKLINVLANDWGYARLRKIVKPKFDLIPRNAEPTTRAKWRSSTSAYRSALKTCLTVPTLLEIAIYRQPLTNGLSDHVWSLEEIALLAN